MDFAVNVREKQNALNVAISGEIDAFTAPKLREVFKPYEGKKGLQVLIDLTHVSYMDSTGLGVLVGLFKSLRANDGALTLTGLSDRLKRLFDITGLSDIMKINTEIEGGV
ncbi:anti-sigma-B factor antagonist [Weizmannia acidilactici]|uniref:Anti-sigma factor antagonist n=1 Tax=Weizmannia acidilactici TaxID=2607726 RepID=A0A5J4JHN1_9BACI|nr:anti-sigma factor antagonist [Weizmannia acidilactici]GER68489.1 anti-sigma-B factor antagonist [Weizmannia acidilactici]GER71623.1 anti-sigma-B factor antagonist [Weizmannia acidilactici]GER74982.1 anti-sigma-B factor antagonist [Weizmannia acidilactici]